MILTMHLMGLSQTWMKYLPLATLVYITFNTSNSANYSPYELALAENQNYFYI